jgi:hypothetical protein
MGSCVSIDSTKYVEVIRRTDGEIISTEGHYYRFFGNVIEKKKLELKMNEYIMVENIRNPKNGHTKWIIRGPILYTPSDIYEKIDGGKRNAFELSITEYIILSTPYPKHGDKQKRLVEGPVIYIPDDPYETIIENKKFEKISLTLYEYVVTRNIETNERNIIRGPGLFGKDPYIEYSDKKNIMIIPKYKYLIATDTKTGKKYIIEGENTIDPEPYTEYSNIFDQLLLSKTQYIIESDIDDNKKVIEGEIRFTPDPYNKYSAILEKVKLNENHFIIVTNTLDGKKYNIFGPRLFTPGPYEVMEKDANNNIIINNKLDLLATEYVRILNRVTGVVRMERGPKTICREVFEEVGEKKNLIVMNNSQYLYVTHKDTGVIDIIEGPSTICPGPHDEFSNIFNVISLTKQEYIYIKDELTGIIRVEKGPAKVILKQYEKTINTVQKAIEINEHNAVIIKNIITGSYELITMDETPRTFIPSHEQEIISIEKKYILEKHEVMIIVDKDGNYNIMRGGDDTCSFFLPPYCKFLTQKWSKDLQKNHQSVIEISKFDMRTQYMDFEFTIRTSDSVEILVDLNFCWQIIDIEKMILRTNDAPQDVCQHAMSQILTATSKKDMEDFMLNFSEIIQNAVDKNDPFFTERGISVIRIEITNRRCKDDDIEKQFQSLIKEKAEKIRKQKQQEAENSCNITKIEGDIEIEKKQGDLFRVKKSYMHDNAKSDGLADGQKVAGFIESLPDDITPEKLSLWNKLIDIEYQKFLAEHHTRRIEALSKSQNVIITKDELAYMDTHKTFITSENANNKTLLHINMEDKNKK